MMGENGYGTMEVNPEEGLSDGNLLRGYISYFPPRNHFKLMVLRLVQYPTTTKTIFQNDHRLLSYLHVDP